MAKSTACRNAIVDAQVALGTWYALHTGDPGTTGANEVSGGSPAYARKQSTIGGASSGTTTGTLVTVDIPASTTITHWSQRTASTAGSHIDGGALPNPEAYAGQGTYDLTPTISQA